MQLLNKLYYIVQQNRSLIQRANLLSETQRFVVGSPLRSTSTRSQDNADEILSNIPAKPKRPPSIYIRFLKSVQPKIVQQNPNFSMKEIVKTAAEMWKNTDKETLINLQSEYFEDVERYNKEKQSYESNLTPEQKEALDEFDFIKKQEKRRKKLNKKQAEYGKPKKPANAFLLFTVSKKAERAENLTDWIAKLGDEWKNLPEAEKNKFQEKAKELFKKYHEEKAEWEAKLINDGHEKLLQKVKLPRKSQRPICKAKLSENVVSSDQKANDDSRKKQ